jgi:hypothetical protein
MTERKEESHPNFISPPVYNDQDRDNQNMTTGTSEYRTAYLNAEQNSNGKTQLQFTPSITDSLCIGGNNEVIKIKEWIKAQNGNFAEFLRIGIVLAVLGISVWVVLYV